MAVKPYNAAETKSDLYSRIPADWEVELLMGENAVDDLPEMQLWRYDPNSMATDDFAAGVIKPTLQTGPGRWVRLAKYAKQGDWNQTDSSRPDYIKNKPSLSAPTYNSASRSINSSSFTPSSTKAYRVYYNVSISCTASIGSNSSGKVELQYFDGSTWVTAQEAVNSNTVALAVVLQSVTTQTVTLCAEFPANTQLRLVQTSSGTTSISYIRGQEILY